MILYVTLIKTTQITHDMNGSQYLDKHAITKVFLYKNPKSFASKGKPRLYQFSAKEKDTNKDLQLQVSWFEYAIRNIA